MKTNLIAALTLLLMLGLINNAIWQKQTHLAEGEDIILALAPVDPRSLMQGDYMALRFEVSNEMRDALQSQKGNPVGAGSSEPFDGYVIVEKDPDGIHRFAGIYSGQPLRENQRKVQFRAREGRIKFATNAFFFSEGQADTYAQARFGLFKRNGDGEILLAAMLDGSMNMIEPVKEK